MTIGAGIFLIAVGAILKYATNVHVEGISIDTIGVILMIAGAVGLILGIFQEFIWSRRRVPPGDPAAMEERREVRDPNVPPRY
ncbi:MAG TPA: DUF6458 family protein [Solirubrobacterales bacterium]|jgi:hypothetical protein